MNLDYHVRKMLYHPIHLPIVFLNPLLNAFLAGILRQLFFFGTR